MRFFAYCVHLLTSLLWLSPAVAQQAPSSVQSQVQFDGRVTLGEKDKAAPIRIVQRTWFIRPGTKLEDLRAGTAGNLIIEVRTGMLTTTIDGRKQTRRMGNFFVVSAGQKLAISTADRSAIVHAIVLPASTP